MRPMVTGGIIGVLVNSSERVLRKIINTGEVGTKAAGCRNSADLELQDGVGLHMEDS